MEIYNEQMQRLSAEPDLLRGHLVKRPRVIHHDAVEGVAESWHYETVREYPNGGKDVRKVIDVPGVQARDAYDEEQTLTVYVPYTAEELAAIEAERNAPTLEEQIEELRGQNEMLLECLMEMSELVYQ